MKNNSCPRGAATPKHPQTPGKKDLKIIRYDEQLFRTLIEQSLDIILLINRQGIITYANTRAEKVMDFKKEDIIGNEIYTFIHGDDRAPTARVFNELLNNPDAELHRTEIRTIAKDKTVRTLEAVGTRVVQDGMQDVVLVNLRDITDRRKAEEALANSEALYRLLADNITEHIWIMDLNLKFTYISPSVEKIYGYPLEKIKTLKLTNLFTKESYQKLRDTFATELPKAMAASPSPDKPRFVLELQAIHADGHLLWIENHLSFIRDENGKPVSIMGETVDITDRKNVQDKLLEEEQRFRALADQSSDIIIMVNREGIVTYENPSVSILGFSVEERLGNHAFEFLHPDDLETISRAFNLLFSDTNAPVQRSEIRLRHRDGSWRTFEAIGSNLIRNNIIEAAIVNLRDITDRKQSEEALKKSEEKYRLLADHMKDQVWLMDLNMHITYVSPSVERITGYSADEIINMPWKLILTKESFDRVSDFIAAELPKALKSTSGNRLFKTIELEFILKNGQTVWGECEFSLIRDEQGNPLSVLGESRNITERKLAEDKLQQTLESLKKAVGTTIQVLISALEARDPYTASHQSRTANLACAIAAEMGLDGDIVEGLNMAGTIHDIGKLSIPAEILSKPTGLTNIEFSMIKTHPESGYEMLKDVESPWPLSEIVYQHHERMDGSGYPRNLKGNDILIEARIMAVADVVEAIASHRPYRPSLGLEFALKEIEKNRGKLYDEKVVDACLKLFREKGYKLI